VIGQRDLLDRPEELVRRVYAFVAYRLGDGPGAEDVTSETFLRALRYRDSYKRERGEPIAWLIGIARRAIAEHVGSGVKTSEVEPVGAKHIEQAENWVRLLDLRRAVGVL
jgi:DNA-directed RNA polymerase specialized sigma24 family protein